MSEVGRIVDCLLKETNLTYGSVGHIGAHLTDLFIHDGNRLNVMEDEGVTAHGMYWGDFGIAYGRVDKEDKEGSIALNVYKHGVDYFIIGSKGKRKLIKEMFEKVVSDLFDRYPDFTWYVNAPGYTMVSINKFYSENF